jgi:predicted ester cyclase
MVSVNLSHYIAQDESKKQRFAIDKCPDKSAYLELKISAKLIGAVTASDTMSMVSGFDNYDNMSIDSVPDSDFNFDKKVEEKDLEGV